jgi:CHAT domain-containing protein
MRIAALLVFATVPAGAITALAQPIPLDEDRGTLEAKAAGLTEKAVELYRHGRVGAAVPVAEQALALRRRLYSPTRFPDGHPELAATIDDLGTFLRATGDLGKAESCYREALQMRQKLYPLARYPQGHLDLATSLNNVGLVLKSRSELVQAEPFYRQALAMLRKLYPSADFPSGHREFANTLNNLGALIQARGELARAEPFLREGLAMFRKLYPPERFPSGHGDLANSLNNLGAFFKAQGDLTKAEAIFREALAMYGKVYPEQRCPDGHPELARSLTNLADLLHARGELAAAEAVQRDALAMVRKLYRADRFPDGHPYVAVALNNLGFLVEARGDLAGAEHWHQEALTMCQKLYSPARFPKGHPYLAVTLRNLGFLLHAGGELARAEPYFRAALEMAENLYPPDRFPDGHPELAASLSNLGMVLQARGELAQARSCHQRALAMRRKLYPAARFSNGHRDLAISLNNLAALLRAQRDLAGAEPLLREALAIDRKLYPSDRFPDGHPDLAYTISHLGVLVQARGDLGEAEPLLREGLVTRRKLYPPADYPYGHAQLGQSMAILGGLYWAGGDLARAEPLYHEALAMEQRLTDLFLAGAAEAEASNYLASLPLTRDAYLSVTYGLWDGFEIRPTPERHTASYTALWKSKAAIARLLQRRRQALLLLNDPAVSDAGQKLFSARQELARLLLAPTTGPKQTQLVRELTNRKEKLEKQLARQLPAFAEPGPQGQLTPADLRAALPPGAAFVDFHRYFRIEHDPRTPGWEGQQTTTCYVAFVLSREQPPRRAELGAAAPIDAALNALRAALAEDNAATKHQKEKTKSASPEARLRELLWAPVARHLPAGTRTIYLVPDGPLTSLPWAALPGARPGSVLLEEYALALVPHGQFLAEQLRAQARREGQAARAGVVLAVGGVDYDRRARGVKRAGGTAAPGLRTGAPVQAKVSWPHLPATAQELDHIVRLADRREVRQRRGSKASTSQILADLTEVRWAHLATHGFFADQRVRSILRLDEKDFERSWRGEKVGAGARSPLVLSGLVLAGANLTAKDRQKEDGGILTAEAIAGLNLDKMELAVLSACETGLGEVAGGEGVFGLQRAFHLAGARNVIASLWKVDDEATAALMALFYHNLWREKLPALEALRLAQLTLYRHPERIPALARQRGPDFEKTVRLPPASGAASARRAPARLWAGFVLSGLGR